MRPPGPVGQVAAVLALRIAALRDEGRRRALLGAALGLGVTLAALLAGVLVPRDAVDELALLLPTAWLLFAAGSVVAATTGTGGRLLLPREQAAPFPLSAAADHLGALVSAPLNVSWTLQALSLVGVTSWVAGPTPWAPVVHALTLAWILVCTVAATALGWGVEILRTSTAGVWAVRGAAAAAGVAAVAVGVTGNLSRLLDQAPTTPLVVAALEAAGGRPVAVLLPAGVLLVATAAAYRVGVALLAVLHRRPARAQVRAETRRHARRRPPRSVFAASLRVDHAGVWRSAPLRRGLLALGAIPGAAAAATSLDWSTLALLPGLATSGAALLFGVNAFCLDGPGALWRETLPGAPRALLLARALVVVEVCLAAGLVALLAAAPRTGRVPSAAEAAAVVGALVVTTAQVAVRSIRWSVNRPYAAALREARDQPAPPAAMAGYSARLAVSTTGTGLVYMLLAGAGNLVATAALTLGFGLLALRRFLQLVGRWDDPALRTRVLATVAGARA